MISYNEGVGRGKLQFSQMNRQRISVLVAEEANADPLRSFFEGHGYLVEVFTEASKLYNGLCKNGPPGFVFVSTQSQGPMSRMMPDFVVKRFKTPVFLFREDPARPPLEGEPSAASLPPEIVLALDHEPDQILRTMTSFEDLYETRLKNGPAPERGEERARPSRDETPSPAAGGPSRSESVLQRIKDAFEPRPVEMAKDDVLTLHACRVSDPDGRGYFVFGFPARAGEDADGLNEALLILESRVREAAGESAVIEHLVQGVPAPFFEEIRDRSDEVVSGKLGDHEMILLYFRNREEIKTPETRPLPAEILVPVEEWWTRLPLPCSAYVWLELNDRKILYVRSGDRLRDESLERFRRKGCTHLAVEVDDFEHYLRIREIAMVAFAEKTAAVPVAA